jgi:hypothetical protein
MRYAIFKQHSRPAVFLFLFIALAAALVFAGPVTAVTDATTGCSVGIQDPHFSPGANGVIVKADFSCPRAATIIQGLQLFWCGSKQPQKNEGWLAANCERRGLNGQTVVFGAGGGSTSRYAPPLGQPGSSLRGWYSGCITWQVNSGTVHTEFSPHPYYHSGGNV